MWSFDKRQFKQAEGEQIQMPKVGCGGCQGGMSPLSNVRGRAVKQKGLSHQEWLAS